MNLKLIESEFSKNHLIQLKPEIEGRSGCSIEIIQSDRVALVEKSSTETSSFQRLFSQYQKQHDFYTNQREGDFFVTPKTYDFVRTANRVSFTMDYIRGETYAQYFTRCRVSDIDKLIHNYLTFLEKNLLNAELVKPNPELFQNKLTQIEEVLYNNKTLSRFLKDFIASLHRQLPTEPLPIGYSHGDLTFSNQIFTSDKVYLIDFLDSFISTPLNDLVKLRQDTKHFWTPFIDVKLEKYQYSKIAMIFKYIDNLLFAFLADKTAFRNWISYLEKVNLLRILPYVVSTNEFNYIQNRLTTTD